MLSRRFFYVLLNTAERDPHAVIDYEKEACLKKSLLLNFCFVDVSIVEI